MPEQTTPTASPKAWERLPDEPPHAYYCFMTYLLLGPTRTLMSAVRAGLGTASNGNERKTIPGQWSVNFHKWRWLERALAWDREQFMLHAETVLTNYYGGLAEQAKRLHGFFLENGPQTWRE